MTQADSSHPHAPVPGWTQDDHALRREFVFDDFRQAFAFMTSVAREAEQLDHHPDWTNVYNRISIRLSTHSAGGVTDRDFELAEAINRLDDVSNSSAAKPKSRP